MASLAIRSKSGINKYPAKAHAHRLAEELRLDDGLLVLSATSNENLPNSDMPAPFRQDRYFFWLTGCNEPDCHVVYDLKNDKLTLWLPPVDNNWRHVVYYGNGSTIQEAMDKYDVDEARYIQKLDKDIWSQIFPYMQLENDQTHPRRKAIQKVLTETQIFCYDSSNLTQAERVQKFASMPVMLLDAKVSLQPRGAQNCLTDEVNASSILQDAIDACRVVKDADEIERIRRANDITAEAHLSVMKSMPGFKNEAQVEAAYMQVCIARRAKEQAYDPIAGSGPNAAVLHYSQNLAEFGAGQTIVLDAGCEVECYASDVTRTIPINRHRPGHWPSKEAENIYKLVEKIQEACIRQMMPGNMYIHAQWLAHEMLVDGLLELGILKGDRKEIFHAGISSAFLPHGLGHHLGLEVHDVTPPAALSAQNTQEDNIQTLRELWAQMHPQDANHAQNLTKPEEFALNHAYHGSLDSASTPPLKPNMVVTVEPGIYFSEFLLKRFLQDPKQARFFDKEVLKRYIPVGGVRIEDDILITKHGYENLTTAPKGEKMLSIIREAAKSNPCL